MIVLYLNDFSNKFINQPALHLENQLNLIIIMKVSWKFNYWCISEKKLLIQFTFQKSSPYYKIYNTDKPYTQKQINANLLQ